jgi:Concanavalin A-like lectin/glucanases superfamily
MFRLSRITVVGAALSVVVGGAGLVSGGVASASTVAALWHMDETSGTTMTDASGNGNNGTLHNVTLGAAGKYGKSYTFGGSKVKSYVEVPNSASLNPGSANITISLWLRTFSLPKSGDFDLVRKGVFTAPEYKVELLQSGQIQCTFRGTTSNHNATGGSGLNNGAWHHIQCIKTGTQIQTVIDGTVVATTKAAVGSISNTYAVEIGAYPGSDWYQGKLDEVSITVG